MRFVVLGAGMQGVACAYDLLRSPQTERVTLIGRSAEVVEQAQRRLVSDRVDTALADCADAGSLAGAMAGHKVVISALPYHLNLQAARIAIETGCSFVDMGGNVEQVLGELRLKPAAEQAGICVVPDCGLAPGLTNVLAADAVAEMAEVSDVRIRVGGLPAMPREPWNYMMVYSHQGLISEYAGPVAILRDWNRAEAKVLSGQEQIQFPEPVGTCEAAYTSGGSSTLPWTFAGRIRNLDFKTVRYPGHYDKLRALAALGLFGTEPVEVGGARVIPREFLGRLMVDNLGSTTDPDVVVLRVVSAGMKNGKRVRLIHEMMDTREEATGLSAMMRTTAFPVSIIAQMIADGTIDRPGAFPPEKIVPPAMLLSELERRGVFVRRLWEDIP